jgi:hypothetical protein
MNKKNTMKPQQRNISKQKKGVWGGLNKKCAFHTDPEVIFIQ